VWCCVVLCGAVWCWWAAMHCTGLQCTSGCGTLVAACRLQYVWVCELRVVGAAVSVL